MIPSIVQPETARVGPGQADQGGDNALMEISAGAVTGGRLQGFDGGERGDGVLGCRVLLSVGQRQRGLGADGLHQRPVLRG